MRNLVRSEGYARARLVTGTIFMALGAVVVVRSVVETGFSIRVLPAVVLGLAMIFLGVFRFRDYLAVRRQRS